MLSGSTLLITEFLASNDDVIYDEDGDYEDWIEIHNPTGTDVSLNGYYLTDDSRDMDKWAFPDVSVDAGDYLLVFASSKDRKDPVRQLHTNFKLDADGEYLALTQDNGLGGVEAVHQYTPSYPDQVTDYSYGLTQETVTLVPEGTPATYLVPGSAADGSDTSGNNWTDVDFDSSGWVDSLLDKPVLITEIDTWKPDWVEIQNVGNYLVDTTGWVVAMNDAKVVAGQTTIEQVVSVEWELPGIMDIGEIQHRNDTQGDTFYLGADIYWKTDGNGWVMIVDDEGQVMDALVWGDDYTEADIASMSVEINGHTVRLGDGWSGPALPSITRAEEAKTLQRIGTNDHDDDSDFIWRELTSQGTQNSGLSRTFLGDGGPAPEAGLGFSDSTERFEGAMRTDIGSQMQGVNASLWVRIPFEVDDPDLLDAMQLQMKYEDGFVAYINGQEVARSYAPSTVQWNSRATRNRSVNLAYDFQNFNIPVTAGLLQAGTNMLAIHGLNDSPTNGDFLVSPYLKATSVTMTTNFMAIPTPRQPNLPAMTDVIPQLSHTSGTFVDPFELSLWVDSTTAQIRYTTDGSIPTEQSTLYTGSITVSTTTRIRARAFDEGLAPGALASEGFIFLERSAEDFSSNLPLIVVDTFRLGLSDHLLSPAISVFIEAAEDGTTQLTDPHEFAGRAGIRKRGQSSQGWPKSQYAFETWDEFIDPQSNGDTEWIRGRDARDLNVSLFGMPSESDWIIQGPYSDKTLMRNYLSYSWAREMGMYAPRVRFVEVFVNTGGGKISYPGDYVGVYVFMEKIKRDSDRVDIEPITPLDNSGDEITGGYIWKKDKPGWYDDDGVGTFTTSGQLPYSRGQLLRHVEPKAADTTPQQQNYLRNYINQFEAALYGPNFADPVNGYAKYIDVDSFIDNWIMVEMTKNIDGFRLSTYYHKDRGGKITMGPIWDYNLSLGNADYLQGNNPSGWYNSGISHDPASDAQYPYWDRMFEDPNFEQRLTDRWTEVRQDIFSTGTLVDDINRASATIAQGQARNFQKWNIMGVYLWPNGWVEPTWNREVYRMKSWLVDRLEWMDTQFPTPASLSEPSQIVQPGFQFSMASTGGTIYYTLDGSDPRRSGGGIAPGALQYTGGTIPVSQATLITARQRFGTDWSAPIVGDYFIGNPAAAGNLVITELNYHPIDPTDDELIENSEYTGSDFEFLELLNTSDQTFELGRAHFTNGIDFTFADQELSPGESIILVSNTEAFELRYGSAVAVAGQYVGNLDNGGERIALADRFGNTIVDFRYDDSGRWPGRADGTGASLELIDPAAVPAAPVSMQVYLENPDNWRSSAEFGGSPGYAGEGPRGDIVINEVFTQSNPPAVDWIELYNTTDQDINIGGWYLSDSSRHFDLYEIPAGIVIPAGTYRVFDETHFNPPPPVTGQVPFALSSNGDDVWLMEGDATGELVRFVDRVEFGAAMPGESFGRWPNLTGILYPMTEPSMSADNAGPRVGPLVISELMYHAADPGNGVDPADLEFVEISNPTGQDVDLTNWRIRGGVDFDFAEQTQLAAGEVIVVASFDPGNVAKLTAFRDHYGIGAGVVIVGPLDGVLDDDGERVELQRPGPAPVEDPTDFPRWTEDEVRFYSEAPWPTEPNGSGDSLTRSGADLWGHDPASWTAASPTPGQIVEPYRHPGDANLDGVTDLTDFNIWNANKFVVGTSWDRADFNGDGDTDLSDFNIWNAYKFTQAPQPVPDLAMAVATADEPSTDQTSDAINDLAWSLQQDQAAERSKPSNATNRAEQAVDLLLASYWP